MVDIPVLETERLVLRPWRLTDAEAVFAYASRPEATEYMIFDTHRTIQDAVDFLSRAPASPEHGYCVTVKGGDDTAIGGCGINPNYDHMKGEVGYILHPDHWGKGYATELTRRLIQYGFEALKLNRVFARANTDNPASIRVQEKAGMSHEGALRDDLILRGTPVTLAYCSILRREWLALKEASGVAAVDLI